MAPRKKKSDQNAEDIGLDDAINIINEKYGDGIRLGNTFSNPKRISTGSLALDVALGGGVPVGRMTRFYGAFSSGKTLTALNTAREAQKLGYSICYWDVEKTFSPKFAGEKIGVDVGNKFWVNNLTVIEEIAPAMELLLPQIDFHIIDSCSSAQTEDALAAAPNDWFIGLKARAWGRAFQRIEKYFDKERNTVILIDQVRTNIKTGSQEATGGNVMDHASSASVMFKKGGWLNKNTEGFLDEKAKNKTDRVTDMQEPEGRITKARVEKAKITDPLRSAKMYMDFSIANFDRTFEYVEEAKRINYVESRGGGNYYYPHPDDLKEGQEQQRIYGEKALRDFIAGNKMAQKIIRKRAIEIAEKR